MRADCEVCLGWAERAREREEGEWAVGWMWGDCRAQSGHYVCTTNLDVNLVLLMRIHFGENRSPVRGW